MVSDQEDERTPERENELAEALERYTDPDDPEYDPDFAAEIRRLRPDWFAEQEHKRGSEQEHELGEALNRYTDPTNSEYDPEFDAKIRKLRPDWFAKPEAN